MERAGGAALAPDRNDSGAGYAILKRRSSARSGERSGHVYDPSGIAWLAEGGAGVAVETVVVPMCGCPVEPYFYRSVDSYEVAALIKRGETLLGRYPLRYADTSSDFAGTFPVELPGLCDITVYACDPAFDNTGKDHLTLTVTEE